MVDDKTLPPHFRSWTGLLNGESRRLSIEKNENSVTENHRRIQISASGSPLRRFDVSVIIPVEYHRGQAVDCVRGWAQEQNYPADRYQIILCAPNTLSPTTEAEIRSLLRPWDRLEKRPFNHDMPLVAKAAHWAESDLILFTESHCLPENNALESLLAVAAEHPEWSGFSCPTTPITHNLLSEIEAEIYATHIRHELESNAWLKVIDQCFLVRRAAYFEAGGFRPEFGHFAEWLLAAEMSRRGNVVGFHAQSVMQHYYIGDVNHLETFTLDFARGQIKYLAECRNEATSTYFPEIPELQEYRQRSRADRRWIARAKTATLPAMLGNYLGKRKHKEPCVAMLPVLTDWLESVLKSAGTTSDRARAVWSACWAKHRLLQSLRRQDRNQVKIEFVDWFAKLVQLGRMQYLFANPTLQGSIVRNPVYPISGKLDFRAVLQGETAAEWQGFFDSEEHPEGYRFRWSKPMACVWLPLFEGHYRIIIEWDKVRPLPPYDLLRVNFDGRLVAPNFIQLGVNRLVVEVGSETKAWHRLDWTVAPFLARHDKRLLGLPVTAIRWFSTEQSSSASQMTVLKGARVKPVYFLHVSKCAGTSLRCVFDNAFEVRTVMAPYYGRYHPDELEGVESEPCFEFYRGHFRWALPAALPDRDWRIVTVLRDPVDRILSRFYYYQQHGLIHTGKSFAEWLEHGLTVADTMTVHFQRQTDKDFRQGADAVRQTSLAFLSEAQSNLRKCLAVGIVEHIEDSTNIFAWHLGFLAPKLLSKHNPTLARTSTRDIPDDLRARIEEVLEADLVIYGQARQQFQAGMAVLHAAASPMLTDAPDTVAVRTWLRQRYLGQMAQAGSALPDPARIDWTPDDMFHGENLHARELSEGRCLRWTGPNAVTIFYFYLGTPRTWNISVFLHSATPREHATSVQLRINGVDIPVKTVVLPSGDMQFTALLPREILQRSKNGVAEFLLTTLLVRGEGEFRMLGVALTGISLWATA